MRLCRQRVMCWCAAVWLAVCSVESASGQVTGPATVGVGELVVLRSESESQWITLDPIDLTYEQFEGGRALAFSSGIKSGRIVVLCVSWDAKRLDRHIVTVGNGPGPDPGPDPGPGPKPDPTPPEPGKLWVIVVEETSDVAPWRGAVLNSEVLAEYLRSKGHRIRVIDDDTQTADGQEWVKKAGSKPRPRLFLADTGGRIRFSGDCPQTVDGMIQAIKKAGG